MTRLGYRLTPEHRAKLVAAWTPERRRLYGEQSIGNTHAARVRPPEERAKISLGVLNARVVGECVYCGEPAQTHDHVIPSSRGGPDTEDNIVPACRPCNISKYNRTPLEWLEAGLRAT